MAFEHPFAREELVSVDIHLGVNGVPGVDLLPEKLRETEVHKVQVRGDHCYLVVDLLRFHQVVCLSLNVVQLFKVAIDVVFGDFGLWDFFAQKDVVELNVLMNDVLGVHLLNKLE